LLAWRLAAREAANARFEFIQREHLMMGLSSLGRALAEGELKDVVDDSSAIGAAEVEVRSFLLFFESRKVDLNKIRRRLIHLMGTGKASGAEPGDIHRDSDCRSTFDAAASYGEVAASPVGPLQLLAALLAKPGMLIAQAIGSGGGDIEILRQEILSVLSLEAPPIAKKVEEPPSLSLLAAYGVDLTEVARAERMQPFIGRDAELLQMVRTLSRKTKRNPLLLGDPGVGKTAIVRALALRIAQRTVPSSLKDRKIIELNLGTLVAGTKYRGDLENRITGIIRQLAQRPDVILFIDEIHTLIGAGSTEGALDAANLLKPALAGADLCIIGSTTVSEYRKYFEKDAALARRFQPILINEPSATDAEKILEGSRQFYEKHHGVRIEPSAIKYAVALSCRYLPDRRLPDKALDLLDEACARLRVSTLTSRVLSGDQPILPPVGGELVAEVVAERTGIPVARLSVAGQEKLQKMEETLSRRVIGQPEAVEQVTRLVTISSAGLRDPSRPAAVLMFLGPTGVGKTELCKALAEFLFGSEADIIRFDMSEFKERHSTTRLIGSPPGYVGYEEEGQLTGRLRSKPYAVVLFDEIEKAHPEVCDLFLQLFDEGKLTDGHGRTVDGRSAIYVMTSNLEISPGGERQIGFVDEAAPDHASRTRTAIEASLLRHFRAEFLNRIDELIQFRPLSPEHVFSIAEKMLERVKRSLASRGAEIRFSRGAIEQIAKLGYDPENGARSLARVIDRVVNGPLSRKALAGEIGPGDCIDVLAEGDRLLFNKGTIEGTFPTVL
jgi:ATP-dependent Clp protease ATP-binding subunit ClpC